MSLFSSIRAEYSALSSLWRALHARALNRRIAATTATGITFEDYLSADDISLSSPPMVAWENAMERERREVRRIARRYSARLSAAHRAALETYK